VRTSDWRVRIAAMEDLEPESWEDLPTAWRAAFALAWESLGNGSPPVGAVVVGHTGEIVSSGRSRRHETHAPQGQLAGSRIAHAEINALAGLAVDRIERHTLLVTLEPCLLCASAAAMAHVDSVVYAGSDPMWRFVQRIPELDSSLAARWYEQRGPFPGPVGAFATLLPLMERLSRKPTGARVDSFRQMSPGLVDLAHSLLDKAGIGAFSQMTVDGAANMLWPDLARIAVDPF
jgi:tRNA(Arg) A34 adenosine deaminase TadA